MNETNPSLKILKIEYERYHPKHANSISVAAQGIKMYVFLIFRLYSDWTWKHCFSRTGARIFFLTCPGYPRNDFPTVGGSLFWSRSSAVAPYPAMLPSSWMGTGDLPSKTNWRRLKDTSRALRSWLRHSNGATIWESIKSLFMHSGMP